MGTPVSDVGVGYDTFKNSAQASVVDIQSKTTGGLEGSFVSVCETTEEILSAMQIDASVSANSPWGSFSDRTSFASSLTVNTTSIHIIVIANWSELTTVTRVKFTDPQTSAKELFATGGDSYVSSVTTGGQYIAAYSFIAHDQETFQSLQTAATANFPTAGLSATFGAKITNMQSQTGVSSTFKQSGNGVLKMPTEDTMVAFALGFDRSNVVANPPVLDFTPQPYTRVRGCPPGFDQVEKYVLEYYDPNDPTKGLAHKELLTSTNKTLIKLVYTIYDYYGFLSIDPRLRTTLDELSDIKTYIVNWRNTVDEDPTIPGIKVPSIESSALLVPTPGYSFAQSAYGGGPGGSSFQDVSFDMVASGVLPTTVVCRGGDHLDHFDVTYVFKDTTQPSVTKSHGGDGGDPIAPIQIWSGTYVTDVEIYTDDVIQRMRLWVNNQPTAWQPDNNRGAQYVNWARPLPPGGNSVFVGFAGRYGRYIDGIEPLYVDFLACEWKKPKSAKKQ